MVMKVIMMMRVENENNEKEQGFVNSCYKIVSPIFPQKLRFCRLQAPEAL